MSDTLTAAEIQYLNVESLPARTVMSAMALPSADGSCGGLGEVLGDVTGRHSILIAGSPERR